MSNQAIDLHRKLTLFNDHWSPRTVAEYNGHDVMVVKVHLLLIEPTGTPQQRRRANGRAASRDPKTAS